MKPMKISKKITMVQKPPINEWYKYLNDYLTRIKYV
jgi:hypothetical protein